MKKIEKWELTQVEKEQLKEIEINFNNFCNQYANCDGCPFGILQRCYYSLLIARIKNIQYQCGGMTAEEEWGI